MTPTIEKKYLPAREYHSPLLEELLAMLDPAETARTENRMIIACRIADALIEKNMSKKDLAQALGQQPSMVTKWLSGKHNFTTDTLTDIGRVLNIELFAHQITPIQPVKKVELSFPKTQLQQYAA